MPSLIFITLEAFSAAVKSTATINENEITPSSENEGAEVEEEDSFLRRLHFHSALLSENVADSPPNKDHFSVFSSSTNCVSEFGIVTAENGQKMQNGYDNRITIELSSASVAKLSELFGDGPSSSIEFPSPVEVNLPIWLCEFLFKATQKMPISNSLREEFEQQNDWLAYDFVNSLQTPNKNCQKDEKSVSLGRLYEMFPKLSKKVISRVAKEMDFDFERTAHYLIDYPDDHPTDSSNSANCNERQGMAIKRSVIVPSLRPRVISAEEQQRTKGTANVGNNSRTNLLMLPPESWDTEVQDVEKELRNMAAEQKHCREMRTKYVGFKNSNIFGFYSARANELELAKKTLTQYWDRLRIWRTSNEECIDLHEMSAERALSVVVEKINICREKHPNLGKLYVITGYGKTTGIAVIKPKLLAFLNGKGIEARVSPKNEGVVEISLRNIFRRIE
ncbi:hypothetical protein niasHT_019998 [Heterodera trifolii]|uniref:Smr domain-containing protein n=1 Tax=Heterodera trifolii TaxID=157864 RepID=A0ABD2L5M5_9BILA